ncbi:invasion associated locus B family protein [Yoonia vestfoldensis]|uniref:Invasion associated locus B (IalB) protein n=1 Tax=Yoonia vestfoldensis TaxID=245188 RepID=A0A1Y0EEZ2_9RHOB|nr:invasion associated locus B family protein [Yoonia vestfoldensis]ARU02206.1 invasion associated locus B (IalB) protein [Yoonia vestfoldensis]
MILKTMTTAGFLAAVTLAGMAGAQEQSENRVTATSDWSVYVETSPRECWAVSAPVETINTRDGTAVDVNRGDIQLIIFYRPGDNITGQIMFAGGYPFAPGSVVTVRIGDTTYELFTEGNFAWPASSEDDARMVAAMKRGADATIVGRSSRGTQTSDKFSLIGFTAAVDEAASRCAG